MLKEYFRKNIVLFSITFLLFILCLGGMLTWVLVKYPNDQSELMAVFIEFGALGLVLFAIGMILDFIVSVFLNGRLLKITEILSIISKCLIFISIYSFFTVGFGYLYYKIFL